MKFSAKSAYGIRFLFDLIQNGGKGKSVTLKDVSERQNISEKYLWQSANALKNAGIVTAQRGNSGGYVLVQPPNKISLKTILTSLGQFDNVLPETKKNLAPDQQVISEISEEIHAVVIKHLAKITLQDLVDREKTKSENQNFVYSI